MSSSKRGEPRLLAPYAKRRLAFNGVTVLAGVLVFLNLPLFIASDVVGEVEFRLPTTVTEGEVVSVESFGPWHHRAKVRYSVRGETFTDTSWASRPTVSVGQRVVVVYQTSFVDHAKIVGQRKFAVAVWQTAVLPCVAVLLFIIGGFVGRRRVDLGRYGLLTYARRDGDSFAFDIEETNPDAGYRDKATTKRTIRIDIPSGFPDEELQREQPVLYWAEAPERGLLLRALKIHPLEDGSLIAEKTGSLVATVAVFIPYLLFSFMLLAYYFGNAR